METIFNSRKDAEVRTRIEPLLKQQSTEVLASLGLDMSDAIRLFLRQVITVQGLPFEVRKPNAETRAAMLEADEIVRSRSARFSSAKELFDALDKESGLNKAPRKKA